MTGKLLTCLISLLVRTGDTSYIKLTAALKDKSIQSEISSISFSEKIILYRAHSLAYEGQDRLVQFLNLVFQNYGCNENKILAQYFLEDTERELHAEDIEFISFVEKANSSFNFFDYQNDLKLSSFEF